MLEPAAARVTPRCAHFGVCGGCALQHLDGAAQLSIKEAQLRDSLARVGRVAPRAWLAPLQGPQWQYRRRARLGARYVQARGRSMVGFRERLSTRVAELERCEVLAAPVDALLAPLGALLTRLSIRERMPQVEVAIAETATVLVLRVLTPPTAADEELLLDFERAHGVRIYLQPGGLASVRPLREPAAVLDYTLPEFDVRLQFEPSDFIQVNAGLNRALVGRVVELLELDAGAQVLDLYCGLGNFTLPLARRAGAVVGVEGEAGAGGAGARQRRAQWHRQRRIPQRRPGRRGLHDGLLGAARLQPRAARPAAGRRARGAAAAGAACSRGAWCMFPATRGAWRAIWDSGA